MRQHVLILILASMMCDPCAAQFKTAVVIDSVSADSDLADIVSRNLSELLTTINDAYSDDDFTRINTRNLVPAATTTLEQLWRGSPFRNTKTQIHTNLIRGTSGLFEVRDIPILFRKDINRQDELVFQLDSNGIIQSIAVAIPFEKYRDIVEIGESETDSFNRKAIAEFIELVQTAYSTKNLDLVSSLYSDDALILVGKLIEKTEVSSDFFQNQFVTTQVELYKRTKKEYLERLNIVFENNDWVDVRLPPETIEVKRHPNPKYSFMYGVTVYQEWRSQMYDDDGFLFLLLDFRETNPIIWVRIWQPQKFEDQFQKADVGLVNVN